MPQSVQERQHIESAFDVRLRRCQVAQLSLVPVQLQEEIQSQATPERTAQFQLVSVLTKGNFSLSTALDLSKVR